MTVQAQGSLEPPLEYKHEQMLWTSRGWPF